MKITKHFFEPRKTDQFAPADFNLLLQYWEISGFSEMALGLVSTGDFLMEL